jgi:acetoin utilization deacetylase AcuC-like enzyme
VRVVFSPDQLDHHARAELIDGQMLPPYETPARAEQILAAVTAAGHGPVEAPGDHGRVPLEAVHTAEFLDVLETAWDRWCDAHHDPSDALPLCWPARTLRHDRVPTAIDGVLGHHSFDAGTPITAHTWGSALASAHSAVEAASLIGEGERAVFALCRPPGHHAAADLYGGYCFVNNAAVAAQVLRDGGAARVAVLDVDYHHGNGTQSIFWERADVAFVSIHADPAVEYPYFLGYADETGAGAGDGATYNLPLPLGTDGDAYLAALDEACRWVATLGIEALVVSLGVDTFDGDPIAGFRLRRPDFTRLGARVAALGLPTVVVMEGGYAVAELGPNVAAVLDPLTP